MDKINQPDLINKVGKVAIYTNYLDNGGISKYVYNLRKALLLQEIQSDIVTFRADTIYGDHIKVLSCKNHWERILQLRKFLKQGAIEIVVTNTWFETLITKLASLGLNDLKVYSVVHIRPNLWGFSSRNILKKIAAKLSLKWCNQVISVSNELRQALVNEGWVENSHIQTIYNPVIFDSIIPVSNGNGLKDKNIINIAVIGWIQPRKAQDIIIEAFSKVDKRDFCINFIGGTDDEGYAQKVKNLIELYQLEDNVKFWGARKDVLTILDNMDLLITASRGEALPTVMIEALSKSVPIISSDCDYGPKEILDDGKYGLLFEVDNPQQLYECYRKMVDDPEIYKKFQEQSWIRSQLFTAQESADKYHMLFKKG